MASQNRDEWLDEYFARNLGGSQRKKKGGKKKRRRERRKLAIMIGLVACLVGVIVGTVGPAKFFAKGEVLLAQMLGRPITSVGGNSACVDVADSIAAGWTPDGKDLIQVGTTMIVPAGSRFNSTGSPAWGGNPGGRHTGADIIGKAGTPVYLPVKAVLVYKGRYEDVGRYGDFRRFEGGGISHYFGHMEQAINLPEGTELPAGTQIGVMSGGPAGVNWGPHTHWQIERVGAVDGFGDIDPEDWWQKNCTP